MTEKVIRDGKVAVLVSAGYGAGWYSWNSDCPALLFDPALVEAVEARDRDRIIARANELYPDGYFGGADGLYVEWLKPGTLFRIDEYDGSESLVTQQDDSWVVA